MSAIRVYSTSTAGKPARGRFPSYASLDIKQRDVGFLKLGREFIGRPFPRKWRPLELYIASPRLPKPDFYGFGSGWVCNQRAAEVAGEALEMSGELLQVSIQGEAGNFYVYNCTNCINVVDPGHSVWRPLGPKGEYRVIERPAFFGERFGEETLFKITEDGGGTTYCLERSGDPVDGEFKAVVDKHGLTGLEFELIWTDEPQ